MVQASNKIIETLIQIRRETALESRSLPPLEDIVRELGSRVAPRQRWNNPSEVDALLQRAIAVEDFRREREASGLAQLIALAN